jgi:hypothetical protein
MVWIALAYCSHFALLADNVSRSLWMAQLLSSKPESCSFIGANRWSCILAWPWLSAVHK